MSVVSRLSRGTLFKLHMQVGAQLLHGYTQLYDIVLPIIHNSSFSQTGRTLASCTSHGLNIFAETHKLLPDIHTRAVVHSRDSIHMVSCTGCVCAPAAHWPRVFMSALGGATPPRPGASVSHRGVRVIQDTPFWALDVLKHFWDNIAPEQSVTGSRPETAWMTHTLLAELTLTQ